MKRTITTLALALPLALVACGGGAAGDPGEHITQGTQALSAGDSGAAIDHFGKALAALDASDPRVEQATLGQVEARIGLDAEAAKTQFLAYAEKHPDLAPREFVKVGSKLSGAGALAEATAVLGAGLAQHPDDAKLDEALKATQKKAEEAGDEGALDALKGLGYTG